MSETNAVATPLQEVNSLPVWQGMDPQTRIWIYPSNRRLSSQEMALVTPNLEAFARQWASHNVRLKAWGGILFDQFLILAVDESHQDASGCSIDTSVRYLHSLEQELNIDLFDRWNFHFIEEDQIVTMAKDDFAVAYQTGRINDDTLVFNNLVNTLGKFQKEWIAPLRQSWHKRFV